MGKALPRVLLADAAPASQHVLQQQLEDAGYVVESVASGNDVISMCEIEPPDVVIIDVNLPDMDGFDVCEHVRHDTRDDDVTVIILAEPNDNLTRTCLGPMVEFAGGDYYFAKPCDGKLIVQLLDDLTAQPVQSNGTQRIASPTRVVWPTARSVARVLTM